MPRCTEFFTTTFFTSIIATLCLGCGAVTTTVRSYEGPQLPDSKLTRVVVPWPNRIIEIDGKGKPTGGRGWSVAELGPGKHTIKIRYFKQYTNYATGIQSTTSAAPQTFQFTSSGGDIFVVYTEKDNSSQRLIQYLGGPYPNALSFPKTSRSVSLVREDVSDPKSNYFLAVETPDGRTDYPMFNSDFQVPVYSKDQKHVAFWTYDGRKGYQWNIDGAPQSIFSSIPFDTLVFSKEGGKYAYYGIINEGRAFVINGKVFPLNERYSSIYDLVFNQDGDQVAYLTDGFEKQANGQSVKTKELVVNGNKPAVFQDAFRPWFSPKTGTLFYFAKSNEHWQLYRNGKASPVQFTGRPPGVLVLDKAERRFAYVIREEDQHAVVYNGKVHTKYHSVSVPKFSPNGQVLAYGAQKKPDGEVYIVINGKERGSFEAIDSDSISFTESQDAVIFKFLKSGDWIGSTITLSEDAEKASPK